MVTPNWGLAGGGNALGLFQLGTQIGGGIRQQREERRERNALTAYANDPSEQNLRGVAEYNPEYVIRQRGAQAQAAQEQQAEQRNQLPIIGRILGSITDEASYQRARQVSQRYGIDMSDAPETYDPAWVQSTREFAQAVATPQGQASLTTAGKMAEDEGFVRGTPEYVARLKDIWEAEQVKTVPFQAGGGIASVNTATGQVTPLVVPQGYAGAQGGGQQAAPPPREAIEALRSGAGTPEQFDEIFGQGAAARIMGGGGGNSTGGFPGAVR